MESGILCPKEKYSKKNIDGINIRVVQGNATAHPNFVLTIVTV
jgi:hypothetical protein